MSLERESEFPGAIAEARIQSALRYHTDGLDLSGLLLRDNDYGGHVGIWSLPESLGSLNGIQVLNLSGNQLTSLPVGIRELRALTHLFLHDNPALGLPLEVLGPTASEVWGSQKKPRDPAAILDYYFRIHPPEREGERAGQVLRELKVILVGRGEVGKTSLIEVLMGGKFVVGTKKTEGIAITRWSLMLPDGEATALVWDFGGQEIMHGTHQFFLTHRSLYLVVVDGRHDRASRTRSIG